MKSTLAILALLLLVSCGSNNDPTGPGGGQEPLPSVLPPDPDGMLLDGAADAAATAATVHLAPSPAAAAQISGRLLTTRLAAVIAPGATVGEVNEALAAHDAAIVSMTAGIPAVTLVVPAVDDIAGARELAAGLVASGAFVHARPAVAAAPVLEPTLAGDKDLPQAEAVAQVPHVLPMRLPAAWNLREAATDAAVLVHPNWYADVPGYTEIPQLSFGSFGEPIPESSPDFPVGSLGFYMLGVAAADWEYDPDFSPHTGTDGAAAAALAVVGVHTYGLDASEILAMTGLALLLDLPVDATRVVLLDTETFDDPEFAYYRLVDRAWLALQWRQFVRNTSPLGASFVHVAAAGATRHVSDPFDDAVLNSVAGVASLPDLQAVALLDATEDEYAAFMSAYQAAITGNAAIAAPLTNVLIVGSSDAAGNESSFSAPGSEVRVLGEGVVGPCLVGEQCDGVSTTLNTTAAAAAQVAGLACYLWHLDGTLTPDDLLLRLQHAYSASGMPGILDASIATLSVERAGSDAELRARLLDVDGPAGEPDGAFTEHDIEHFLEAFDAFEGASTPDWSVYDLNGDGWTAGAGTARLDLDANDLPGFTEVEQAILGEAVSFDETALTDQEVLCYFAWSDLYSGDPGARDELLGERCVDDPFLAGESLCSSGVGLWVSSIPDQSVETFDVVPVNGFGDYSTALDDVIVDGPARAAASASQVATLVRMSGGAVALAVDAGSTASVSPDVSLNLGENHAGGQAEVSIVFEIVGAHTLGVTGRLNVSGNTHDAGFDGSAEVSIDSFGGFQQTWEASNWEGEIPELTLDEIVMLPAGLYALEVSAQSGSRVANADGAIPVSGQASAEDVLITLTPTQPGRGGVRVVSGPEALERTGSR